MSTLSRLSALALLATLMLLPALPAAAERTQSDFVLIPEGDVIAEDLYAAGDVVLIAGLIEGDLVASAFSEVRIEGEVRGSVTVIASRVVITGNVGGSLRAISPDVVIDGRVGDDVLVTGWTVELSPGSEIGRDALVWAREALVRGRVGRNLEGQMRTAVVGAQVAGDVDITVSDLTVTDATEVAGDLVYVGDDDAQISNEATVGGSLIAERALAPNVRIRAMLLLIRVLMTIAMVAIGLGIIWASPDRSIAAAGAVTEKPWQALAWGTGLVSIPIAMAVIVWLFVSWSPRSTGLPLLGIFAPIVFAVFGILLLSLLAAPVPVAAAIGRRVGPARSVYAWFVIGIILLLIVTLVPWLGIVVMALTALIGLGAWLTDPPESGSVGSGTGTDEGSGQYVLFDQP